MNEEDFCRIGKFILNRVGRDKFGKLLELGIGHPLNESYVDQKWDDFKMNSLSFLVCYPELTREIIKEIKEIGYKG